MILDYLPEPPVQWCVLIRDIQRMQCDHRAEILEPPEAGRSKEQILPYSSPAWTLVSNFWPPEL